MKSRVTKADEAALQINEIDLREAARVLKTQGTKKRERCKAASVLGLIGGSIGGNTRAANLTPERRSEIARLGGLARQARAREQRAARAKANKAGKTKGTVK